MYCKLGSETLQDIVARTIELLSFLKGYQLPNGTQIGNQQSADVKIRTDDHINRTKRLFKTLQYIYVKVTESCENMDYTPIQSLIPYEDDDEVKHDKKKTDAVRRLEAEANDLKKKLVADSAKEKLLIDETRKIIWNINTMLYHRGIDS